MSDLINIALRRFLHNHSNISRQEEARCRDYMYYSYQGFFIVHSRPIIDSIALSRSLNSLEHDKAHSGSIMPTFLSLA